MKKTTLNVGMIYSNIITAVAFVLMVAAIVCMYVVFPAENLVLKVILTIVFGLLAIGSLIGFLLLSQTVTLSEQGMTFRCAFVKVIDIKWNDILKLEIISLPTLESRGNNFNFKWIIVYTDLNQQPKNGGGNYWHKPPWQIKASKKNIEIIKVYIDKYLPSLNFKI